MSEIPSIRTALVVVDMQNGFCHPDGSFTGLGADMSMCIAAVPGCGRLIGAARAHGIPVIFTQVQYRADYADGGIIFNEILGGMAQARALVAGTWDAQIVDDLKPEPGEQIIYKNRYSSFYGTQLEPYLTSLFIENLVICGVTTSMCVETTVRDAAQRNYRCYVPRDAVGEVLGEMHDAALQVMEYGFARIVDTADVTRAWSGDAVAVPGDAHNSPDFLRPHVRGQSVHETA